MIRLSLMASMLPPDSSRRPPHCAAAPLLTSLLPLVGGILAARHGSVEWLLLAGFAACLLPRPTRLVLVASLLAGFLLMSRAMDRPHPLWTELPPRESTLTLRIEETFNARKPRHLAGIGQILASDIPHDTVCGRRVAFYLEYHTDAVPECGPGDRIECLGMLSFLTGVEDPDSYTRYLLGRYIHLGLGRGFILNRTVTAPPFERLRRTLRTASLELLTAGSGEPESTGAVLASMMLGDRSLLTDDRVELYRKTGSFHLFAVSGLHVGSVALCLHLLTGLLRIPRTCRLIPVLAGTWAYVWLTGEAPSAVRAGIMISCLGLARTLLHQPHLFPALVLSAWLVLLWSPGQLFNLGFQLSYGVVGSILLIGLPVASLAQQGIAAAWIFRRRPLPPWKRLLRKLVQATASLSCVSLSASLASMPLIIEHFGLFTPGGILLGPLLNPLATLAVMSGTLALLLGSVPVLPLGILTARLGWPPIEIMEWLLRICLRIPGTYSHRSWPWPGTGTLLVLLMLGLAWLLQRMRQAGYRLHPVSLGIPVLVIVAGLALSSVDS